MKRAKAQESPSDTVIRKARDALLHHRMIQPGEKVLAAVSGGADSVALLHILLALRQESGFSVHVAHLHHGIRGKAADEDENFVQDLASRLDLPLTSERANVPAIRREKKLSLEDAARRVRYEFLERTATRLGAARIATGHTADDRVETFLLNLARGSGPRGLCALAPVRGRVVRPLIRVWRREIEAYLGEIGERFRVDESNQDQRYARNKIRWVTIPFLEEQNPGIARRIADLCEILSPEQAVLDQLAEEAFDAVLSSRAEGEVTLSLAALLAQPAPMQRLVLRRAIEKVRGDLADVGLQETERILTRLAWVEDFGLTLPSGQVSAVRRGEQLCIGKTKRAIQYNSYSVPLPVPGSVGIPGIGLIMAEEWEPADHRRSRRSLEVVVDGDTIAGVPVVRSWRHGDRMMPLGMTNERKLQDIFTDAKMPASERARTPIVADSEKIVWAAGVAMSELVKVGPNTRRAIRLSLSRTVQSTAAG